MKHVNYKLSIAMIVSVMSPTLSFAQTPAQTQQQQQQQQNQTQQQTQAPTTSKGGKSGKSDNLRYNNGVVISPSSYSGKNSGKGGTTENPNSNPTQDDGKISQQMNGPVTVVSRRTLRQLKKEGKVIEIKSGKDNCEDAREEIINAFDAQYKAVKVMNRKLGKEGVSAGPNANQPLTFITISGEGTYPATPSCLQMFNEKYNCTAKKKILGIRFKHESDSKWKKLLSIFDDGAGSSASQCLPIAEAKSDDETKVVSETESTLPPAKDDRKGRGAYSGNLDPNVREVTPPVNTQTTQTALKTEVVNVGGLTNPEQKENKEITSAPLNTDEAKKTASPLKKFTLGNTKLKDINLRSSSLRGANLQTPLPTSEAKMDIVLDAIGTVEDCANGVECPVESPEKAIKDAEKTVVELNKELQKGATSETDLKVLDKKVADAKESIDDLKDNKKVDSKCCEELEAKLNELQSQIALLLKKETVASKRDCSFKTSIDAQIGNESDKVKSYVESLLAMIDKKHKAIRDEHCKDSNVSFSDGIIISDNHKESPKASSGKIFEAPKSEKPDVGSGSLSDKPKKDG